MTSPMPPLVVMGVSGCGKSTIGALLAGRLGVPFLDGDDFHPASNKAKMAAGIPLDDADRAPWLTRIGQLLAEVAAFDRAGQAGQAAQAGRAGQAGHSGPPVVACSALKRSYRDLLRNEAPGVVFVHLTGDAATIAGRLNARAHEFMPSTLLESQLATLEALGTDEAHVLGDIALPPGKMVDAIVQQFEALSENRPLNQAKVPA
jgi:gluconokinase